MPRRLAQAEAPSDRQSSDLSHESALTAHPHGRFGFPKSCFRTLPNDAPTSSAIFCSVSYAAVCRVVSMNKRSTSFMIRSGVGAEIH